MADLTITESQVVSDAGVIERVTAGATVTKGQSVYRQPNNTWALAQHDGTALESGAGTGVAIAISGGVSGQEILVQRGGVLTLGAGAAPVAGTVYCVSATAGGICPLSDVGSGDYVTVLGVGKSGNKLAMGAGPIASGQTIP